MPKFTINVPEWRRLPEWCKTAILARSRLLYLSEVEQEEERCLEGMLHWHDPVERLRTLRCRRRALVDDNPASG
jgi:hypothetical protein